MTAVRRIFAIGLNTFREAIRNKVLGTLLFFAIVSSVASTVLGQMSLHEEVRVTLTSSLFLSMIFGVVIAVHSTVTLFHTEFERRTIYSILSKPVPRWQFVLGKYFGVLTLLGVVVVILFAVASGIVVASHGAISVAFGAAFFALYLQLAIVTALALLFATVSSPLLSGMFTVAMFIAGSLTSQLEAMRALLEKKFAGIGIIFDVLKWVLPNLESLNLSTAATYGDPVPGSYWLSAAWYAATYAAIVLVITVGLFSRRDFQ